MGAVHPLANVASHEPAVIGKGLSRLLGLVPVAGEHSRVLDLDLACFLVDTKAELRPVLANGLSDRSQLQVSREVRCGDGRVLSHSVKFVDRHADPHEELQDLRGDGGRTGSCVPAAS